MVMLSSSIILLARQTAGDLRNDVRRITSTNVEFELREAVRLQLLQFT